MKQSHRGAREILIGDGPDFSWLALAKAVLVEYFCTLLFIYVSTSAVTSGCHTKDTAAASGNSADLAQGDPRFDIRTAGKPVSYSTLVPRRSVLSVSQMARWYLVHDTLILCKHHIAGHEVSARPPQLPWLVWLSLPSRPFSIYK